MKPSLAIPRWRLALTGAALVVLAAVGAGLVSAAPWASAPVPAAAGSSDASSASLPTSASMSDGIAEQLIAGGSADQALPVSLARRFLARRLVHAVVTVDRPNGGLVTFQLDHGAIASLGDGTMTIREPGGSSVTARTDATTRVRIDRRRSTLGDLRTGDDVYVLSLVQSGRADALARLVVVPASPVASQGANPQPSASAATP